MLYYNRIDDPERIDINKATVSKKVSYLSLNDCFLDRGFNLQPYS